MDASTQPGFLPANFNAESVNRQYRGGVNRTRPPFIGRPLEAGEGQSSDILDRFAYGNFQGALAYRAIKQGSVDGIVCAVGGSIYFITLNNGRARIYLIATGNESNLMNTWFVQAEDWVYIQNGYQNAIAWDGVLGNASFRLNPAVKQMPIGTIMAYSNGRVFVSDKFNNIYASDIIFGAGTTVTNATQSFTETTYWQEGGSFTPPSNLGNITGMYVMPTLNLNERGQGELVVFCDRGAFTLNTVIPRDQWKDAQIQKTSLVGRGNVSSWSITGINNECFFRSNDGWSMYSNSQVDFSQKLAFRKFSREVNRWVDNDTTWMKQFASGMFFDNRFIATVNPYTVQPRQGNQAHGLHRPNEGMIVLDLDYATAAAPDASINWRWNGVWVGPQPTQLLTAFIEGQERGFAFSFDSDGQNRIYELMIDGVDDFAKESNVPIRSYFTTKRYSWSDTQQTNKFLRKSLIGGEMWLSDMNEQVTTSIQYRPDSYPCWNDLQPEITFGCTTCSVDRGDDGCQFVVSNARYKRLKTPTPKGNICQVGANIPTVAGAEFQLQVNLVGSATVDRLRIACDLNGSIDLPIPDCQPNDIDCTPISCCPYNNLSFYRTVDPSTSATGPGSDGGRNPNLPDPYNPTNTVVYYKFRGMSDGEVQDYWIRFNTLAAAQLFIATYVLSDYILSGPITTTVDGVFTQNDFTMCVGGDSQTVTLYSLLA